MRYAKTALAQAEAQSGLMTPDLTGALASINAEGIDLTELGRGTALSGVPVIPADLPRNRSDPTAYGARASIDPRPSGSRDRTPGEKAQASLGPSIPGPTDTPAG